MRLWVHFLSLCILPAATVVAHAERVWDVAGATATFSMSDAHLADLGLQVVGSRANVDDRGVLAGLGGTPRAFATGPIDALQFRSEGGRFLGFVGGRVSLPFRGGLAIRAKHPASGRALAPVLLYDFVVEFDPDRGRDPIVLRSATSSATPLQVRDTGFHLDEEAGELSFRMGDLQISPEWALELGRPRLAHQWIGGFDLRVQAATSSPQEARVDETPGAMPMATLDVLLAELYGITSQGHAGSYPNGTAGLSAATTSCNPGDVPVPWDSPMDETHPFIGLALFREQNGTLEMIGKNWIKHGFFALSSNQCGLGCSGGGGNTLGVGCSDTYSASNNGSRYYLGPRAEVDPYHATWTACGSFFDEPVTPDPDCNRNYNDNETDPVLHRLVVRDADLANPGATYYFEGEYFVANDAKPQNNIGWRQCTMSWGGGWSFTTLGGGVAPNLGPLAESWGDFSSTKGVGPDDGQAVLSVAVTDLGGGQYHYEYMLYNWRSARGIQSISIPVGVANVTNIGFRDIDTDSGNDWVATLSGGRVTWATEEYVTNPDANALDYQTLFNFRFDCDAPPVDSEANGKPFRPGVGTEFLLVTKAPASPVTGVAVVPAAFDGLSLSANEPNPFAGSTRLSFALPSRQTARVTVHDLAGRTVRTLFDGVAPAGRSQLRWDGRDSNGSAVASGVYFFRLDAADGARAVKGTLMR